MKIAATIHTSIITQSFKEQKCTAVKFFPARQKENPRIALFTKKMDLEPKTEWFSRNKALLGDLEVKGFVPYDICAAKIKKCRICNPFASSSRPWANKLDHVCTAFEGSKRQTLNEFFGGHNNPGILTEKDSRVLFASPKSESQLIVAGSDISNELDTFFDHTDRMPIDLLDQGKRMNNCLLVCSLIKTLIKFQYEKAYVPFFQRSPDKFFHIIGSTKAESSRTDPCCNEN